MQKRIAAMTLAVFSLASPAEAPLLNENPQLWHTLPHVRREMSIESIMKRQPSIERDAAESILYYDYPLIVDHFELKKEAKYVGSTIGNAEEFMTEPRIWTRLSWVNWDQLPSDVRKSSLDNVFDKYSDQLRALGRGQLSSSTDDVGVIDLAGYLIKIRQSVEYWSPQLDDPNKKLQSEVLEAILLQESFANKSTGGRDIGVYQLSPPSIKQLQSHPEFESFKAKDFENPEISIWAGVYWFTLCLNESRGDYNLAIKAYNAGILDAKAGTKRAIEYHASVIRRYDEYILGSKSPTWDYVKSRVDAIKPIDSAHTD